MSETEKLFNELLTIRKAMRIDGEVVASGSVGKILNRRALVEIHSDGVIWLTEPHTSMNRMIIHLNTS